MVSGYGVWRREGGGWERWERGGEEEKGGSSGNTCVMFTMNTRAKEGEEDEREEEERGEHELGRGRGGW